MLLYILCPGITTNAIVLCAYATGNAVSQFMWKAQYKPRWVFYNLDTAYISSQFMQKSYSMGCHYYDLLLLCFGITPFALSSRCWQCKAQGGTRFHAWVGSHSAGRYCNRGRPSFPWFDWQRKSRVPLCLLMLYKDAMALCPLIPKFLNLYVVMRAYHCRTAMQ